MKNKSVQALLEDIRLVSEQNYEIVEAVRALVQKTFETTLEEVKYGGILFRSGVQFGGIKDKKLAQYLSLALQASKQDDS